MAESNIHGITPGRSHGKPGLWQSGAVATPFGSHATLTDDLVSYWRMDEESGVRTDVLEANDLTDTNTVLYDTGKAGNAAKLLQANNESLDLGVNLIDNRANGSVSCWFKCLVNGAVKQYQVFEDGYITYYVYRSADSTSFYAEGKLYNGAWKSALSGWTTQALGWDHLVLTFDDAAYALNAWYNGNKATKDYSSTVHTAHATTKFQFEHGVGAGSQHLLDEAGVWSRVLTDSEIADLYNSGDGLFY